MVTDNDIQEIKSDLSEIKRLLLNAGFVGCTPARVYEIGQKAKRDAEKIKGRLNGDKTDKR